MVRHLMVTTLIVALIYFCLLIVIDHPFVASADASHVIAQNSESSKIKSPESNASISIFGLQRKIDFKSADRDIAKAWNDFSSNESLQNNVDWNKGNIVVYAYFYDFNQDMSKGRLAIGYSGSDLLLNTDAVSIELPQGKKLHFKYNTAKGTAEDKAWEAAYRYKNLIERHTLDANGEIVTSDVVVIK